MTDHDSFFQRRKPAAVLKHAVMSEYFTVFLAMVGSKNPKVPLWVIDGYAGPGAYAEDDDGAAVSGSPLVALGIAEGARIRKPALTVNCAFIEADESHAEELTQNIKPFKDSGLRAEVFVGEVQQRLSDAWALVGTSPVVTLLDPFGVSMPRDMLLDPLLKRREPASEVLVNLSVESISRIGGNLAYDDAGLPYVPLENKKYGGAVAVERVDDFFGGTAWRELFLSTRAKNESATDAAVAVIEAYRADIENRTGTKSIAIPIRRRQGQPILFLFTLFFRHDAAAYKFCDAASRGTRKWRDAFRREDLDGFVKRESAEDMFPGMEDLTTESLKKDADEAEAKIKADAIDTIAVNIERLTAATKVVPVGANIVEILGDAVGLGGETHLKQAWDRLAKARVVQPRNTKTRRLWAEAIVRQ